MPSFNFKLNKFTVGNTRSWHTDTDHIAVGLQVGDKKYPVQLATKSDVNNGTYVLNLGFTAIPIQNAGLPVYFNFQIVNAGHHSQEAIDSALRNGFDSLVAMGAKALGDYLIPGSGSIWSALGGKGADWLIGLAFADCDGAVAIDQLALNGATVAQWTASGPHIETRLYRGSNSPSGCGSNSEYHAQFSIERVGGLPFLSPVVTATSRSSDKLDLFAVAEDGTVSTASWQRGDTAWKGWWPIAGGTAPAGSPVTATSRRPDFLDAFVVGNDSGVYTAAWDPTAGQNWRPWRRVGTLEVPVGSGIECVCRSEDHLDIFAVGSDGFVYTAAWEAAFAGRWAGWWPIGSVDSRANPGSPVTAISPIRDNLHVFVVGTDGAVRTATWKAGGSWSGWSRVGQIAAIPESRVSAVSRRQGYIDIFVTGADGKVYTAALQAGDPMWRGWWQVAGGSAPPGSPIGAVSRSTDHLDIFVVGGDGKVYTAAWEPTAGTDWHGWWQVAGGSAPVGSLISAAARSKDHLDIFVIGGDKAVYTAAWEPSFGTQWHGWSRVGAGPNIYV